MSLKKAFLKFALIVEGPPNFLLTKLEPQSSLCLCSFFVRSLCSHIYYSKIETRSYVHAYIYIRYSTAQYQYAVHLTWFAWTWHQACEREFCVKCVCLARNVWELRTLKSEYIIPDLRRLDHWNTVAYTNSAEYICVQVKIIKHNYYYYLLHEY